MFWQISVYQKFRTVRAEMTDNELRLKKLQLNAVMVIGVVALFVFLGIAMTAFYYLNKWQMAGCL